jgi:hypothetical protein
MDNGSRLFTNSTTHVKAKSHDYISFRNPFNSKSTFDIDRPDQTSSASILYLHGDNPTLATGQLVKKDKRQTGYHFLSPWNGRCEFSSTIGNSLQVSESEDPREFSLY